MLQLDGWKGNRTSENVVLAFCAAPKWPQRGLRKDWSELASQAAEKQKTDLSPLYSCCDFSRLVTVAFIDRLVLKKQKQNMTCAWWTSSHLAGDWMCRSFVDPGSVPWLGILLRPEAFLRLQHTSQKTLHVCQLPSQRAGTAGVLVCGQR